MTDTINSGFFKVVGHDALRKDGEGKLTGETRFAGDLVLPGMLHARLVTSRYAHARINSIDISEALKVPGVFKVITAADLPIVQESSESRRRNPLAKDEVIFYGQPIAVVLGETEAAALDGVDQVFVDYDPLPVVSSMEEALKPSALSVRSREAHGADTDAQMHATVETKDQDVGFKLPHNVSNHIHFKRGDIEGGFSEAAALVENTYTVPMIHQSYIEPQSCLAEPTIGGGVTLYTSTQASFIARQEVSAALNIPLNKVKIIATPSGGAFGGKFVLIEPFVAALAKVARRPVRLVFYRMEDLTAGNPSFNGKIELKIGARADGTLCALKAKVYFETGAYPGTALGIAGIVLAGYYRVASFDIECFEVLTHKTGVGAYRAPGSPQTTFALESAIDALARAMNRDLLEFRLQNCIVEGDIMVNGKAMPRIGLKECIEQLAKHPLWLNRDKVAPGEGIGVAIGGWPGGLEPASSTCRLDHDGNITVTTGVSDISGVTTSLGLIVAETLGLQIAQVTVENADTSSAPYAGASGGSKTLYTVGAAVLKAAQDAKEQVLNIASSLLEANPQDLELQDGKVLVKGVSSKSVTLKEIAAKSMSFGGRFEPVFGRGNSAIVRNAPGFTAHLAKVRVDSDTGEVEVLEYVAVQDVGKAINPAEVHGQIHGGVTQGLGWALYEQMVYDEEGTLINGSLMDYALQSAPQVPNIEVQLVEIPSPDGPFGAKGVGEPPIVPGGATICNAIYAATGVRINEIPAVPERVRAAVIAGAQDKITH
ncbi:xanthine dehydrogenase family protein molybdopterin-binding subunit [Candidatus Chlorohelix sp.]|uniref:xanthine dehydrogenase family protein molybdopterin-binding subunit n=1 Tax=Candidatus Chlorohelix sp. TaxID=3139201 RepID=UPI00302EC124